MNIKRYKNLTIKSSSIFVCLFCLQVIYFCTCFAANNKNLTTAIKLKNEGKYPESITKYYDIIETSPLELDAYYNLAELLKTVLADYETAMRLYDKALSIAENKITFFTPDEGNRNKDELNDLISNINKTKSNLIEEIFNSIQGMKSPRYIVLKTGKKTSSKSLTNTNNEHKFKHIINNKYYVYTTSDENVWIDGNNIRMIYKNSNERNILPHVEMATRYSAFAKSFPNHKYAIQARNKSNEINKALAQANVRTKTVPKQQTKITNVTTQKPPTPTQKSTQHQLKEVDDRYKKGIINDEERKRLRMEILTNL